MRVAGRGSGPPPRPDPRARAIRLFDRSDFTRFSPTLSAYRLHSGADSPLECLSLPWMPRIPASMFLRLYAAIHRSGAGQSGASRAGPAIPKTREAVEKLFWALKEDHRAADRSIKTSKSSGTCNNGSINFRRTAAIPTLAGVFQHGVTRGLDRA